MDIDWKFTKACLLSGAAGAVVGALALSQVFGFMSPSTAQEMAETKSDMAVVAALAPGCAQRFKALPDVGERMAKLNATKGTYQAKEAFPERLVTVPGESYVDYDLARACETLVLAESPKTAVN